MSSILEALSSAWIPDLVLLAMTAYARVRSGSWFSPAAFFGLYWVGVLTASLIAMDHALPGLGIWALVTLVMAVQMGSAVAETRPKNLGILRSVADDFVADQSVADSQVDKVEMGQAMRCRLQKICLFLLAVALFGCIYFVWVSLDLFGQMLSVASLIQMAAKWTVLRYGEFSDPWPLRLAAIWMYPAALLGGILSSIAALRRERLLGISSVSPALLYTFLTGGRAAFILAFALWLAGRWAARIAVSDRPATFFRKKTVLAFAALAAGMLLMFTAVNTFRGAKELSHPAELFLEFNNGQIRNYMFGPPAAFAEWFAHGDNDSRTGGTLTWGALTFQGMFDTLQIRPKTLGTYSDSERTVGSEGTNIFTMFRGLIQDFSFPGAILVCVFWGWCGGRAYARRSLAAKNLLVLAAFYAVAIFGGLMCPFTFNSTIFAWVVAWMALGKKTQSADLALQPAAVVGV
jgi:oligosaccharide repeat unit polymerase